MKVHIGQLSATRMSMGELMPERDRLQDQVETVTQQLHSFKVHEQYVAFENEANDLTAEIHDLANDAMQLKRLIEFHDRSIRIEQPAADSAVIELYAFGWRVAA